MEDVKLGTLTLALGLLTAVSVVATPAASADHGCEDPEWHSDWKDECLLVTNLAFCVVGTATQDHSHCPV